eukprot:7112233-Pyramimonas_sp.AAC.1
MSRVAHARDRPIHRPVGAHRPVAGRRPAHRPSTGLRTACAQTCDRPVNKLYTSLSRSVGPLPGAFQACAQPVHRPVTGPCAGRAQVKTQTCAQAYVS